MFKTIYNSELLYQNDNSSWTYSTFHSLHVFEERSIPLLPSARFHDNQVYRYIHTTRHSTYIRWFRYVGEHVINNLCYLICLRQLIRSRAVTTGIFSPKRPIFLQTCVICSELPYDIPVGS